MSCHITGLRSKQSLQETHAGGKGASLARLCRDGFNVPPGFVVTAAAFRAFLSALGIETLAQRTLWTQADMEQIRTLFVACPVPAPLARTIGRAYRRLGGGRVAVRSSMVGEDTGTASFAGQLDTFLNVQGEDEVVQAIKQCWASLFNWRLVRYLAERESGSAGVILPNFSIAVVVQRMVDAQVAGIAFSTDPLTGQSCVIVEAARGLGDALVGGRVTPDRYRVDARGVLAEMDLVDPAAPILQESSVVHLAEIVREVANRAAVPQDVEWAWDGSQFYLLQSRPITSLSQHNVYSNHMVSDMLPGLVKPLVWSTNAQSMTQRTFGRVFTALLGPSDTDFSQLVKRIHSRLYANVTMLNALFARMGLPGNFFELMARDERARHAPMRFDAGTLRAVLRLARFAWRHASVAPEIEAFVERHNREMEPYRRADWSTVGERDLLAQIDHMRQLHGESQWFVFIGPMNMMIRNRLLGGVVQRLVPGVAPADLIRGLVGLKAIEPNAELYSLAAQVRAMGNGTEQLLSTQDDVCIRTALSGSPAGRSLVAGVDSFLERYGFLSTNGTDFTGVPWAENPTLIWHAIDRVALHPPHAAVCNVAAIREEACKQVRSRLRWPLRWFFNRLLASTIRYIDLRERTSLLLSEDSYQLRRLFLALGDRFVAHGQLAARDDLFYLEYDEVRALAEGGLAAGVARERVAARQAEMAADGQIELPDTVFGEKIPTAPIRLPEGQEYLIGIGGSSGQVQGTARVVLDPSLAPAMLTRDDILVVPFTDVGWTPLFSGIGGIVAETGGQLSHTSIVAREYGLPAVVSVRQATQLIRDGQSITVDGDRGRIYLKHLTSS